MRSHPHVKIDRPHNDKKAVPLSKAVEEAMRALGVSLSKTPSKPDPNLTMTRKKSEEIS